MKKATLKKLAEAEAEEKRLKRAVTTTVKTVTDIDRFIEVLTSATKKVQETKEQTREIQKATERHLARKIRSNQSLTQLAERMTINTALVGYFKEMMKQDFDKD